MKIGVPREIVPGERRVALTPDAAAAEASSNLTAWTSLADNLVATGASCAFSTNASERLQFFRIYRAP